MKKPTTKGGWAKVIGGVASIVGGIVLLRRRSQKGSTQKALPGGAVDTVGLTKGQIKEIERKASTYRAENKKKQAQPKGKKANGKK